MLSKSEIQTVLKDKYKINKAITNALQRTECQELLDTLEEGKSVFLQKLIQSFAETNSTLGKNNRILGQQRSRLEKKYKKIEQECQELQGKISDLEIRKNKLKSIETNLSEDNRKIEQEIDELKAQKQELQKRLHTAQKEKQEISSKNKQLIDVNGVLKRENRDLKNINDALRLKFAQEMARLMNLENSEIRKGLLKLVHLISG